MTIQIDPVAIRNAAGGLDAYVVPDLKGLNSRLLNSFTVTYPGFGVALLPVEAYYNFVCMYHADNIGAGAEVVASVAQALRKTAENYKNAETVNAKGFTSTTTGTDSISWASGFGKTSWATEGDLSTSSGAEATTALVELFAMSACMFGALACAAMSPPFMVVPIVAAGLIANFTSIYETAREIAEIASDLGDPTVTQFHDITLGPNGAASGWKDTSVQAFTRKMEEISAELGQTKECLYLVTEFLKSLLTVLGAVWVAFIAFIPPFCTALTTLTATGVGITVAQVLGTMAAGGWVSVFAMVMAAIATLVTLISGFFGDLTSLQSMDGGRDGIPDLKQIKIEWASLPQ